MSDFKLRNLTLTKLYILEADDACDYISRTDLTFQNMDLLCPKCQEPVKSE